jgi:hypothetical protein
MSRQRSIARLIAVVGLLISIPAVLPGQRLALAAANDAGRARDSLVAGLAPPNVPESSTRTFVVAPASNPPSVNRLYSRTAAVVGAVLGGAVGFVAGGLLAPHPHCDICSVPSSRIERSIVRGTVIGALGGAAIGWEFFGRE